MTKHKHSRGFGGSRAEPLKVFEVKLELTDTILGRDEEDAVKEFKKWLERVQIKEWNILSVTPTGSNAW